MRNSLTAAAITIALGLGVVFFATPRSADACSAAGPSIHKLLPADGSTVPPGGIFFVSVQGTGTDSIDVTLTDEAGGSASLEPFDQSGTGVFQSIYLYKPAEPLAEGAYTLKAELKKSEHAPPTMFGSTTAEAGYTVSSDAPNGQPAKAENLELATAHVEGFQDSCASGSHYTRLRFAYPGQTADVGYFKVTLREKAAAGEKAGKYTRIVPGDAATDGRVTVEQTLDYEVECASVDAYSPDGMKMTSVGTCQRAICAEVSDGEPWKDGFWEGLPACEESEGGNKQAGAGSGEGCGGCAAGADGDGSPVGSASLLLALVGFAGLRRMRG